MFDFFNFISKGKDRTFFRYLDKENVCSISCSEYFDDICETLSSLTRMFGDIKGRHIGVLVKQPYDSMVVLGATIMGKAVVVPINLFETPDNIEYIIDNADIEILIVSDEYQGFNSEFTTNISELKIDHHEHHFEYDKSMDEFCDDSYLIVYTSGTTGKAKGVILPFGNITGLVHTYISSLTEFTDNVSSLYLTVPLYHIMGIYYWIASVRCGWIIQTNYNVGDMLYDMKMLQPDLIIATPAFIKMIEVTLKRNNENGIRSIKYIVSGGAQLNENLTKRLSSLGIMCMDGYGMTETAGAGTFNTDPVGHSDSIGVATPGVQIKFIDGEMCIEGTCIMKGYYKDDEATSQCLIDGAIHTGDLGYIDEDGYVYITGRKKNLIILSGGENVSPEEIERKLYLNQHIKECKVYEKNDRIYAGIYADSEYHEEIEGFVTELNACLPIFKRIKKIEFQDIEFEKTLNGKIKR